MLVVGGSAGLTGAIVLAARAAARAGAGYVRVCAPAGVQAVLASHLVEPMVLACGEDSHGALTATAQPAILAEAERAGAVALGPGMSRHRHAAALARTLGETLARPLVLDADALVAHAPLDDAVAARLRATGAVRVLTPHVGEMAALSGLSPEAIEARRIDIAIESARRWGVVVLLKGAPTVIAAPDGRATVNPTGHSAMATAGMGDVLTGALTALIAQGLEAYDAACVAAFAHGLAGERTAAARGETGIVAGDVVEELPAALQWLRNAR